MKKKIITKNKNRLTFYYKTAIKNDLSLNMVISLIKNHSELKNSWIDWENIEFTSGMASVPRKNKKGKILSYSAFINKDELPIQYQKYWIPSV